MDRDLPPNQQQLKKVYTKAVYVTMASDEPDWWNKLLEPVPTDHQCKTANCTFAPPGHRKHASKDRNYSIFERRLIIQYLVHYKQIYRGKGIAVWHEMNESGYLRHRSPDSLNNFFKRTLIRDIRGYRLPQELEQEFSRLNP